MEAKTIILKELFHPVFSLRAKCVFSKALWWKFLGFFYWKVKQFCMNYSPQWRWAGEIRQVEKGMTSSPRSLTGFHVWSCFMLIIVQNSLYFTTCTCAAGIWRKPGFRDTRPRPFQHLHGGSLHPDQPADLVPERDGRWHLPESRGVGLHTPRYRKPTAGHNGFNPLITEDYISYVEEKAHRFFSVTDGNTKTWIHMTKSKCWISSI